MKPPESSVRRAARPIRCSAFTLMEVIVAMVVVSVLMTALYAGFRSAWVAQQSGYDRTDQARQVAEVLHLLRSDLLGSFQPAASLGTYWQGERGGDGASHTLSMYTNTAITEIDFVGLTTRDLRTSPTDNWPRQPIGGDIQQVVWTLQPDTTGYYTLIRRSTRNVLATGEPAMREQVMLRGVRALDARYYDGSNWQESWDSAMEGEQIPLAVEVIIELSSDHRPPRRMSTTVALPMSRIDEERGGLRP